MPMDDADSLQPTLSEATRTLKTALNRACGSDLETADTGELIRIEEVLAIANDAAKEAISVRRRLRTKRPAGAVERVTPAESREIADERGVIWKVFAVHPSIRRGRAGVQDRFRDGWLSFDSAVETRRVAPIPSDWESMSDAELLALAERNGIASPRRK